jgi:hypothetical protein
MSKLSEHRKAKVISCIQRYKDDLQEQIEALDIITKHLKNKKWKELAEIFVSEIGTPHLDNDIEDIRSALSEFRPPEFMGMGTGQADG